MAIKYIDNCIGFKYSMCAWRVKNLSLSICLKQGMIGLPGLAMLEEKIFDTGTVKLNYAEGPPSGPPILLLSMMTKSWRSYQPIIPVLTPNWHVFALDYRGHGKSGRVPGRYKALDHYEDLKAFVNQLFTEPVVLLGHSMGSGMSLTFADEYPEKLRGLILGDASLDQDLHIEKMTTRVMQRFYTSAQRLAGKPKDELVALFEQRSWQGLSSFTIVDIKNEPGVNVLLFRISADQILNLVQRHGPHFIEG